MCIESSWASPVPIPIPISYIPIAPYYYRLARRTPSYPYYRPRRLCYTYIILCYRYIYIPYIYNL